eukprot:12720.XXX_330409_327805_1 [CDS] Oithona nana genome sequencing.
MGTTPILGTILITLLWGVALADTGFSDIYSAIKTLTSRPRIPFFDPSMPTKLTVPSDTTAVLGCRVHNLGNYTLAWLKHKELDILSVGKLKYSSDNRYRVVYRPHTHEYQLHISYVQPKDEGIYECQISTKPISAFYIHLRVTEGDSSVSPNYTLLEKAREDIALSGDNVLDAKTEILGSQEYEDVYVKFGDMINLTCVVSDVPAPPKHVFWYHDEKVISYYSNRGGLGGVSLVTVKGVETVSQLLIKDANEKDEGSYTCDPSCCPDATTRVFVLDEAALLQREALIAAGGLNSATSFKTCDMLISVIIIASASMFSI